MVNPMMQSGRVPLLTVLLSLAFLPALVVAQDASWEETMNAASTAAFQGRLTEAEKFYLTAVRKAEAFGLSDSRLATSLENLGMFYFANNRHAEGEFLLRRAYNVGEKAEGPAPFELERIRANLAGILQAEGKDREAEKLYLDAVEEGKKSGKEDLRLAESLEELGGFYEGRREFDEAEPLFKKALEIKRGILPSNDLNLTEPLARLTMLYQNAGEYSKAEPYMLKKLDIEERAFGPESINFAQGLNFLADLYRAEGKHAEAETTLKRVLSIHTKLDGPESPAVAGCLTGLADLATRQTNYAEAEQFYKQAVAIEENTQGAESIGVLSTLEKLAELHRLEKDYTQAEAIYKRVLATQTKSVPDGSGMTLGATERLGSLYEEEGKFSEAEALYHKTTESNLATLPRGHLSTTASLNDFGLFLERRDRQAEAETYYKAALDQFGGPQPSGNSLIDSNLAIVMRNYARLLRKMNRSNEAAPYERAANVVDERLAPKPLRTQ